MNSSDGGVHEKWPHTIRRGEVMPQYTKFKKDKDKDTQTQTKTETKYFQDPMYAIFIKSMEFKNLKCDIGCLLVTKTQFYALVELNIFQG